MTIREPIHLKSLSHAMSVGDSFADGILAGYEMFALTFTPEQLLFLIRDQEEDLDGSGDITTIVNNESLQHNVTLNISVLNRFLNSIIAMVDNQYSYRDYTYVSAFLAKSGIHNVDEFISTVKNYLDETKQVMASNRLYEDNKTIIRNVLDSLNIYSGDNVAGDEYGGTVQRADTSLTTKIFNRMAVFDNASMVNRYATATSMRAEYSTALPDISSYRQQEYAYYMEQGSWLGVDDRTYQLVHLNPYEARITDMVDENTVMSQVISSFLMNLTDNMYVVQKRNGTGNAVVGLSSPKAVSGIFSDSVTRLMWNQTNTGSVEVTRQVAVSTGRLLKEQHESLMQLVEGIRDVMPDIGADGVTALVNRYGSMDNIYITQGKEGILSDAALQASREAIMLQQAEPAGSVPLPIAGDSQTMTGTVINASTENIDDNVEMEFNVSGADGGTVPLARANDVTIVNQYVSTGDTHVIQETGGVDGDVSFAVLEGVASPLQGMQAGGKAGALIANADGLEKGTEVHATAQGIDGGARMVLDVSGADGGAVLDGSTTNIHNDNVNVSHVQGRIGETAGKGWKAPQGSGEAFAAARDGVDVTNIGIRQFGNENNINNVNNIQHNDVLRQKLVNIRVDMRRARKEALLALENQELMLTQIRETKTELSEYNEAAREDLRRQLPEDSRQVLDRVNQYLQDPQRAEELGITVPQGDFRFVNEDGVNIPQGDVSLVYGDVNVENHRVTNVMGETLAESGRIAKDSQRLTDGTKAQGAVTPSGDAVIKGSGSGDGRHNASDGGARVLKSATSSFENSTIELIRDYVSEYVRDFANNQKTGEDGMGSLHVAAPMAYGAQLKEQIFQNIQETMNVVTSGQADDEDAVELVFSSTPEQMDELRQLVSGDVDVELEGMLRTSLKTVLNRVFDTTRRSLETVMHTIGVTAVPDSQDMELRLSQNELPQSLEMQILGERPNEALEGRQGTSMQGTGRTGEAVQADVPTDGGMDEVQLVHVKENPADEAKGQNPPGDKTAGRAENGKVAANSGLVSRAQEGQQGDIRYSLREMQQFIYEKYIYFMHDNHDTIGMVKLQPSGDVLLTLANSWIGQGDVNYGTYHELVTALSTAGDMANALPSVNAPARERHVSNEGGIHFIYDRSQSMDDGNSGDGGTMSGSTADGSKNQVTERTVLANENINEYHDNVNVTNHTEKTVRLEGDSVYYDKLQKSMESLVERQISGISERVYSRLEKKMSNERSRRGY